MLKRVLTWGGIILLVFLIAYRPDSASAVFGSLGSALADVGRGLRDFFSSLIA